MGGFYRQAGDQLGEMGRLQHFLYFSQLLKDYLY